MIHVPEAINFIKIVEQTRPLVAICGFEQGDKNQYGNKFGGETRLVYNFTEAVDYLIKFPKTTAYLMRRCPEINLDVLFEKLDRTLFSWIGLSIYLLEIKSEEKLLIYQDIVASADDDYSLLPYSYRVFGNLYFATKVSIEFGGKSFEDIRPYLKNLKREDEILLNLTGLQAHYSWKTPIRYKPDVYKKELKFLKKNWLLILSRWPRFIAFLKLCFFRIFFFASKLFSKI